MFNEEITDEKPWKVLPGTFGNSTDNIKIIDNFIDKTDLLSLQNFQPKENYTQLLLCMSYH